VFGVMDETKTVSRRLLYSHLVMLGRVQLKEGEIFLQTTGREVPHGPVAVMRAPALHPGEIYWLNSA
jgi:hypothetical protein